MQQLIRRGDFPATEPSQRGDGQDVDQRDHDSDQETEATDALLAEGAHHHGDTDKGVEAIAALRKRPGLIPCHAGEEDIGRAQKKHDRHREDRRGVKPALSGEGEGRPSDFPKEHDREEDEVNQAVRHL